MKHFKVLLLIIGLILTASIVFAGDTDELNRDFQEIKQGKKNLRHTIVSLNNLSLAIDFWHDANLKADRKAIIHHEQKIYQIIEEDIRNSYQAVSFAKLEVSYSKDEAKEKHSGKYAKKDDRKDFVDDKKDLSLLNRYVKSKKYILKSLQKSRSFSYKYRLLADYQQLLRQEYELDKVEVAEDVKELQEDVGMVRSNKR